MNKHRPLRFVSLFSGIEAASVAAEPLGWEPVCFCEIDAFPSAVLAHHYPDVPNLGDVTKVDWKEVLRDHGPVDVVVGGSPCQSFSVAGKREGLAGASGLMFEYIRAVSEIMPRYWVWENVPGALSSSGGGRLRVLPRGDGWHQGCWWRAIRNRVACSGRAVLRSGPAPQASLCCRGPWRPRGTCGNTL